MKKYIPLFIILGVIVVFAGGCSVSCAMITGALSKKIGTVTTELESSDKLQEYISKYIDENGNSLVLPNIKADEIPEYSGTSYIYVNKNTPLFTVSDLTLQEGVKYSDNNISGGGQTIEVCISDKTLPAQNKVNAAEADTIIKGSKNEEAESYHKSYMISSQIIDFAVEKKNISKNAIMCTNTLDKNKKEAEKLILEYIKANPGKRCLYRVTSFYKEGTLIMDGILIEGYSLEDAGEDVNFCIYCYNI